MKFFRNFSAYFDQIDLYNLKGNFFFGKDQKFEFSSLDMMSIRAFSFQKSGEILELLKTAPSTAVIITTILIVLLIYYKTTFRKNPMQAGNTILREDNRMVSDQSKALKLSKEISRNTKLNIRQQEVFDLVLAGLSNKAIGEQLFISPNTVKYHLRNIYRFYGVGSRVELFAKLAYLEERSIDHNEEQQFTDMSLG